MRAQQFIKEYGLKQAREVVSASANALVQCKDDSTFYVNDLKRLVESVDLVNQEGSLEKTHAWAFKIWKSNPNDPHIERLKQAITDYESIYGEGSE